MKKHYHGLLLVSIILMANIIFAQEWIGTGTSGPIYRTGPVGIGISPGTYSGLEIEKAYSNTLDLIIRNTNATATTRIIAQSNAGAQNAQLVADDANSYSWVGASTGGMSAWFFKNGGDIFTNTGNVGIGTSNPQSKLAVNGKITATEVEVTSTGWPDFVFSPGYNLKPLTEVEQFIQTNGHLPEVPSAKDVAANGIALGKSQAMLLKKIEELTLYVIQLDKENRNLKAQVDGLDKDNLD